jgi:hypothetical protein
MGLKAAELEKSFLYRLALEGRRKAFLAEPPKTPTFYYTIFPQICQGVFEKNFAQISFLKFVQNN